MDIVKLLMEDSKVVALKIKDGDITYPIRLESLHHPDILDPLLEDGWELVKLPYGLRKGNVKLEDIPRGMYAEEGITADEEVEMAYMVNNLYDSTDLRSKMSETSIEYYEFEKPVEIIKTREDLLEYLDRLDLTKTDSTAEEILLPINAITNPAALFTVEEYFESYNINYRLKLERLRNLSIKQFTALYNKFKEIGLAGEFSLKGFIDFYFSWGIPGLNIPIISKEEGMEDVRIDSTKTIFDEKYIPYYKRRVLTYLNANGEVYRDSKYSNSGWKECSTAEELATKSKALRNIGYNYVMPTKIEAKISEPVTYMTAEDYEIVYDSNVCVIKAKNGRVFEIPTITVRDSNYNMIRRDLYKDILEGNDTIYEEMYINAIAEDLLDRTRIKISTSSYDALKTTGASDRSISRYVFKNEDLIESYHNLLMEEQNAMVDSISDLTGEGSKAVPTSNKILQQSIYSGIFVTKAKAYLLGDLDPNDTHYSLISRVWEAFTSGELSVDNLQSGKLADANADNKDAYVEYFKIAHRYLGVSLDEICKSVASIDLTELSSDVKETAIEFEGNGLAMQVPVKIINNAESAYNQDILDYKNAQAKKAFYVYYVEGAIEELGGTYAKKRHVGLYGKCLKLYDTDVMKTLKPVIQQLTFKFYDLVEEAGYVGEDSQIFADVRLAMIYQWIFQIGYSGKFKIPQIILPDGQDEMQEAQPHIIKGIRASWRNFCDSTVKMMDITIDSRGEFYSYCTNAIVTPYYVIPKKEFSEINVYSFVPSFVNTLGPSFDEKVAGWLKGNMMPMIKEPDGSIQRGFDGDYQNCCAPSESTMGLNEQVEGLRRYWSDAIKYFKEMGTQYNLGNPPHPYEKLQPGYEEVYIKEERKDGLTTPQMWRVEPVKKTNREEFILQNPEFAKLYNPERKATLRRVGFYIFKGYTAEDFLLMSDFDDLGLNHSIEGQQGITRVVDNLTVRFGDVVAKYTDIEDLYETGKYKIKRISGRKFVCEDINGLLIGVTV